MVAKRTILTKSKMKNNKLVSNVILVALLGATAYFGYKAIMNNSQTPPKPPMPPTPTPANGSTGNNTPAGNNGSTGNNSHPANGGSTGNNTPAGSNTPAAPASGYTGCKPCRNKKIKLYSKGCEVYELQKFLNANYSSGLVADGDWGNNTQSAVYTNLFDKLDDNGAIALSQLSWSSWAAGMFSSC